MGLYDGLRAAYRFAVPLGLRKRGPLASLARGITRRYASHDSLYTREYFLREVDPPALAAASAFQRLISTGFPGARIVDIGCGTGALLRALSEAGHECAGLEYAQAALDICRDRGLSVRRFDLENDTWSGSEDYDVAISIEVAEHLPSAAADRFVDLVVRLAPAVVFTAAVQGQGGRDHVNEQPHAYWITRFADRGYTLDQETTRDWRSRLAAASVADWYSGNLMVFRRAPGQRTS